MDWLINCGRWVIVGSYDGGMGGVFGRNRTSFDICLVSSLIVSALIDLAVTTFGDRWYGHLRR